MKKRDFPYFKIQQLDKRSLSWKSYRNANFRAEEDARDFLADDNSGNTLRIMRVDKHDAHPLDQS
jgi:hypothetical protein